MSHSQIGIGKDETHSVHRLSVRLCSIGRVNSANTGHDSETQPLQNRFEEAMRMASNPPCAAVTINAETGAKNRRKEPFA